VDTSDEQTFPWIPKRYIRGRSDQNQVSRKQEVSRTELLGLFWTLSIVLYVEDKRPQRFGDWIFLRPHVDGAG
jgi:hypothetical protein